ncbi:bifunctional phosphopantothenoylcysteine decarboxylase/phosphopantothenate--cysteine ligase CoaBC [Thiolapillus sp.]
MAGVANQNILLGVTGGIAAYKSVELARLLVKGGARVRVVMTEAACRFVSPLTFQAVTANPVRTQLFDEAHEAAMGHIELARWADQMIIAPASADFMARMAQGLADDLLSTLYLASTASVTVAPAMNRRMWRHPAVQHNLSLLEDRGIRILGPETGEQACGDTGIGRMSEPSEIFAALDVAAGSGLFAGRKVLITAGPTHEPFDPVRFIGNRSSGKMGFAVAQAFVREGAEVLLVSGPVQLATPAGVQRINVQTALQMREAVFDNIQAVDIFVACAAVADYRPESPRENKIKKTDDRLELNLLRNPDILAEVAALEKGPFTLGFAAETENLAENARAKLSKKKLDMLAANRVGDDLGFESDDNSLLVLWPNGEKQLPLQNKQQLAHALITLLEQQYRDAGRGD